MESIYSPSDDIVARNIAGEVIIVPLTSGIGDLEDELYTLNDTGLAIWEALDGKSTLHEIAEALSKEYDAAPDQVESDVLGLVNELYQRGLVVEVAAN
jgi:hypothetical protein